jgi:hypothetical protein
MAFDETAGSTATDQKQLYDGTLVMAHSDLVERILTYRSRSSPQNAPRSAQLRRGPGVAVDAAAAPPAAPCIGSARNFSTIGPSSGALMKL